MKNLRNGLIKASLSVLLMFTSIPDLKASYWDTVLDYPKLVACSVIALVTGAYLFTRPDTSLPTLSQLNVVSFVPVAKGVKEGDATKEDALRVLCQSEINDYLVIRSTRYQVRRGIPTDLTMPVSIYSGGYSNECNPYSYCGFNCIKSGLVPGACVTFDFATDTRRAFNFCQKQDLHCVKTVCDVVRAKNPKAPLILHGACKGAANNLRFLAESAEQKDKESLRNITAVIAESPPISVRKALQHTPLPWVTRALMRLSFPNYNPSAPTIMDAKKFPSLPVLVAGLPEDTISKKVDMETMKDHLNKKCDGRVELFFSQNKEIWHGKIGTADDYRAKVGEFLGRSGCTQQ